MNKRSAVIGLFVVLSTSIAVLVFLLWFFSDPFRFPPHVETVQIEGFIVHIPPGAPASPQTPKQLQDAIRKGVELMNTHRLDKEKCVPESLLDIGWKRCLGDYLAAAVDAQGTVQLIEIYGGVSYPAGFTVVCEREGACDSGVNPPFRIKAPTGWIVIAIRTALLVEKPLLDSVVGAVYVPYSSILNTPELRRSGIEYLRDAVLAAYYELRAKDVTSKHINGKFVTDFGTPDHIIALILTEQMLFDKKFVEGTNFERLEMLNRTLVILALNRWRSFQYTKSPGIGARGIGQVLSGSYQTLRAKYERADLPEDDVRGRIDHHASIKAMICHTDDEWWAFKAPEWIDLRDPLLRDTWQQQLVLTAGYNASMKTVRRVLRECKEQWRQERCVCGAQNKLCDPLPKETRFYLVKYEWIYKMLFDAAFRAQVQKEVWPLLAQKAREQQQEYEHRSSQVAN